MMMEGSISGNFSSAGRGGGCLASRIRMSIWGLGRKINSMGRDFMCMPMGKSIRGSFWMVRNREGGIITTKVGLNMKGNGKKIRRMGLGYSFIQIMKSMKEIGSMDKKVVKELIIMH
jgi:hypothetical protein